MLVTQRALYPPVIVTGFCTICVSVIFLFTLFGRHNAGMDHPLLNMYSFFLLYISIAFLVYCIFPNNMVGAIVSIPAILLVIWSISNLIKIRKDR